MHVTLLHAAARNGVLHGHHDDITDLGRLALRTTQHLDALDSARTRIIGDVEIGFHLDHWTCTSLNIRCRLRRRSRGRPSVSTLKSAWFPRSEQRHLPCGRFSRHEPGNSSRSEEQTY